MKIIAIVVASIIVIGAVLIWILAPENSNTSSQPNTAQTAVAAAKAGTAYLYDVRTPEEFASKHIENAINFDVEKMKSGTLPNVPKNSEIYVYCRSGNRSAEAKQLLISNGYSNITDLGGLDDLKNAGVY